MKKLLTAILIVLLIILVLVIAGGAYLYFSLKPFFFDTQPAASQTAGDVTATTTDKHPLLTPDQEQTLEKFGVDPTKLPTQITPAMEACFTAKLGEERVNAIKGGEAPTAVDFFKAQSCLTK